MPGEKDFSIWVGDLTSDVDDLQLYRFFSNRYQSIKSAKGNLCLTESTLPSLRIYF